MRGVAKKSGMSAVVHIPASVLKDEQMGLGELVDI